MTILKSPLSIIGAFFLLLGLYLVVSMIAGAWPTYFAFIFLIMGVVMMVADHFIRKSELKPAYKLILQLVCVIPSLVMGYLFFAG